MENRELKFRGWVANEMYYHDNRTIFFHSNVPQISIMQFTGIKDKNGKEIYEGDIVKMFDTDEPVDVVFEDGAFGYMSSGTNKQYQYFISFAGNRNINIIKSMSNDIEIIGNIYENAGLLAVAPLNNGI